MECRVDLRRADRGVRPGDPDVGALNPGLSHVGGYREVLLGLGLLLVGVVLFFYRKPVQDRVQPTWRDDVDGRPLGTPRRE